MRLRERKGRNFRRLKKKGHERTEEEERRTKNLKEKTEKRKRESALSEE